MLPGREGVPSLPGRANPLGEDTLAAMPWDAARTSDMLAVAPCVFSMCAPSERRFKCHTQRVDIRHPAATASFAQVGCAAAAAGRTTAAAQVPPPRYA